MKTLLRFELKKIYSNVLIYIALLLFMALFYFSFLSPQIKFADENVIYRDMYEKFGGVYSSDKLIAVEKENEIEKEKILNKTVRKQDDYITINALQAIQNEYTKIQIIEDKKSELTALVASGHLSKTEAIIVSQQLKMFNNLPVMHVSYYKPIAQIIDFFKSMGIIFPVGIILLGLSSIFTDEYKSRMDELILSSRNGRRQFITAKLFAAGIYAIFSSLVFSISAVVSIVSIYGGLHGWDVSLQMIFGYGLSPFALTAGQYLFISILFNLLGCIVFALLTVLISSLSQSSLVPLFSAGTVFALPFLISEYIKLPDAVQDLLRYSYTSFSRVEPLHATFDVFVILGRAVLSRNIMFGVIVISILLFTLLIYRCFARHRVSN
jgi:hypothetical protein